MTSKKIPASWRAALALLAIVAATAAHAQAGRTWVSGVGDDVNPCSRTAPCKTFAGAISKTAAGGTISVLDPGGFGTVTITKSITIDGGGIEGSILNSGTNGVTLNSVTPGEPAIVHLRNLSINGGSGTGYNGVRFINGGELHLDNVQIFNNRGIAAGQSWGILVTPTGAGIRRVYVRNSQIHGNGSASSGGGINLAPGGGGFVYAVVTNTDIAGNQGHGIRVGPNSFLTLTGSTISGSRRNGVYVISSGTDWAEAVVRGSTIHDSGWSPGTAALHADGTSAVLHVADSSLANNMLGVLRSNGGVIKSSGDNQAQSNAANGTLTPGLDPAF